VVAGPCVRRRAPSAAPGAALFSELLGRYLIEDLRAVRRVNPAGEVREERQRVAQPPQDSVGEVSADGPVNNPVVERP
jgi:hypothetical protein